jgi:uncharacterized protein (TIGR03435 family)
MRRLSAVAPVGAKADVIAWSDIPRGYGLASPTRVTLSAKAEHLSSPPMRRHVFALALIALMAVTVGSAQTGPRFEVTSVKPVLEQPVGSAAGVQLSQRYARFSNVSLKDFVGFAFGMRMQQIVAPDWLGSVRFEIAGTLPETYKPDHMPAMMQALLEDRFHMRAHRETREFAVYGLEVSPGGIKASQAAEPALADGPFTVAANTTSGGTAIDLGNGATLLIGNNRVDARKVTMMQLAEVLARFVDRNVLDMTALTGRYDVMIELTPEDFRAAMLRSAVAGGAVLPPQAFQTLENSSLSAIPDALKSLGLLLQPRRASLEVVVIDSIDKTPTEN